MHTKRTSKRTTTKNRRKKNKTYKKRNNMKKTIKRRIGGTTSESQRNYAEMDGILGDIMEEGEKYFIIDLFVENDWDNYAYRKNRIINIINSKLPLYKKQRYIRTTAMATDDDLTETEEM
jgi:hypothetical protein